MNTAIAIPTKIESAATVAQPQKSGLPEGKSEFRKMLTESLNSAETSDTAQVTKKKSDTETVQEETKAETAESETLPSETDAEGTGEEDEAIPVMAAIAAQIIQRPEVVEATTETTPEETPEAADKIQPAAEAKPETGARRAEVATKPETGINKTAETAEKAKPETDGSAAESNVRSTGAESDRRMNGQTQTSATENREKAPYASDQAPTETRSVTTRSTDKTATDTAQAATTDGKPQESKAQTKSDTQVQVRTPRTETAHVRERPEAQRIGQEARQIRQEARRSRSDSAEETVKGLTSAEKVSSNAKPETAAVPRDTAQSRFDAMLAKAAGELGKSKADSAVFPKAGAKETADAPQSVKGPETQRFEAVKTETPVPAKTSANTVSAFKEQILKAGQRQRNENDGAAIELAGNKQPEIRTHETVKSEQTADSRIVRTPDQAEQIRAQVVKNIENDKMEFEMRLNPKELGKVDVKMILESGKLNVEIVAANAKSAEMLTKQAESLVASLKASNIEVSSVNVVTAGQNASGNMDGEFNMNSFEGRNQAQEHRGHGQSGAHGRNMGDSDDVAENLAQASGISPQSKLNYAI